MHQIRVQTKTWVRFKHGCRKLTNKSREPGCHVVQQTMDKQHDETIQFYKKLGFVASHEGLKLHL